MPISWRDNDLSGDEDVGLDYHVQVVVGKQYRCAFYVQVKGTENPTLTKNKKYLAVRLKSRTINHFQSVTEPVMLTFFDLSKNEDPRKAEGFYVWIHDVLKSLKGDSEYVDDKQETHTIHVPLVNKFSANLDVSDYCLELVRRTHASKGVVDAISSVAREDESLEITASAKKLSTRIRAGGRTFLDSVLADSPTPWVQAPEDSFAGKLRAATEYLKLGDDVFAEELLEQISGELAGASLHEQAEYQYLFGRIFSVRGNSRRAAFHYKRAHRLYQDESKFIVAWIQEKMREIPSGRYKRYFARLIALLPSSDRREVVCLKSKLLAGLGKHEDAIDVLEVLPQESRYVSLALVYTLRGHWRSVHMECDKGLNDAKLPARHKATLHILKGRAIFQILLEDFQDGSEEMWVPLTGPTGIDSELLKNCWLECTSAIELLRREGWPLEIEHLAEYLPIVAVSLSKYDDILNNVREAAKTRPHLVALQACLERLALMSGNIPLALKAIDRQPTTPELNLHKAYLCWEDGQNDRALEVAATHIADDANSIDSLDPQLLVIGAVAAHELLKSGEEAKFADLLASNSEWAGEFGVYKFLIETLDSPLTREKAIKELLGYFASNPDCELLQGTLLRQLQTRERGQAHHFIKVAERIRTLRELELRDIVRLAEAHFTLENWPELNSLADNALERFGARDELVSIKALVLECTGESAAALEMLEPLVRRAKHVPLALDVYTNIAIRCGFVDNAISIATRMLQGEEDSDGKRELLRLLFVLKMMSNKSNEEIFEIAWRYGQLVSQEDEVQEGIFLQLFLIATLDIGQVVEESYKEQFQDRLQRYFDRFPESKVLRPIKLTKSADPSSILRQLESISGFDEERKKRISKVVNDLHGQRIAIPFEWRPRNILPNVGNVFHLWEIAKNSDRDSKEFHLMMCSEVNGKQRDLRSIQGVPLLDLVSLIVIDDLDLWEILFGVFDRIAVTKCTLVKLQNLSVPMLGLGFSYKAKKIVEELRNRMNLIVQPGASTTREQVRGTDLLEELEEMVQLVSSGSFFCFSDDVCIRSYIQGETEGEPGICTFDLLNEAETREILSSRDAASRIAKLGKWNVGGVPIAVRHFLNVFPSEVDATVDPEEIGNLIEESTFAGMVEGLWDFRSPYIEMLNHVAVILVCLCVQRRVNPGLMAALWRIWLNKVRFRTDVAARPNEHLAWSMALTGGKLGGVDQASVKRLWNAYGSVVELEYGKRMDEEKEVQSIELVGRTLARIVKDGLVPEKAERLVENLCKGFTEGTSEYSRFVTSYQQERVALTIQE